jgi:hypothetical protein
MNYLKLKIRHRLGKLTFWLLVFLPLVIGLLWGSVGGLMESRDNAYYIGLVDFDQSELSADLMATLAKNPSLAIVHYGSPLEARQGLSNKEVLQTYVILEGFEEKIQAGHYGDLIEVVSMMKSPYSAWLDDQISVSVIREWIVSDGYKRLQKQAPLYTRSMFKEAFDAYYANNELLTFTVVSQTVATEETSQGPAFYEKGFLWSWVFYLFILALWGMKNLYGERVQHVFRRLELSGISRGLYLGEYLFWLACFACFGGGLGLLGVALSHQGGAFVFLPFLGGSFLFALVLFGVSYGLSCLTLNENQLTFLYLSIFMVWSLLSTDLITLIPMGGALQYLSPIFIFFKFCL